MVPWPILYWRFTENKGLLVSVQPVCVFQPYELLLQQYFWLTVKYILLNYLKTFSYNHMVDKSQEFLSVSLINKLKIIFLHMKAVNYQMNNIFLQNNDFQFINYYQYYVFLQFWLIPLNNMNCSWLISPHFSHACAERKVAGF